MLVLTRKAGETLTIGENITITITKVSSSGQVKVGIEAPRELAIQRHDMKPPPGFIDPKAERKAENAEREAARLAAQAKITADMEARARAEGLVPLFFSRNGGDALRIGDVLITMVQGQCRVRVDAPPGVSVIKEDSKPINNLAGAMTTNAARRMEEAVDATLAMFVGHQKEGALAHVT